jgi:exopolysaccharide production protein ExoQ
MPTVMLKPGHPRSEVERPSASSAQQKLGWTLLLPLLFFVVHGVFSFFSTGTSVGGFSPGSITTRDPGVLGYAFAGVAYLIVGWLITSQLTTVFSFAMHFKMLTLLAMLTIASAFWSQNPGRSFLYGFLYFVDTLFAYYLVIRLEPEEIMAIVSRLGVIVSVLGLLVVIFLPQYGVGHDARNGVAWEGIFGDRTGAAKELVYLLSPALISRSKSRPASWLLSVLLMTLMIVMAHSVSAIFVLSIYVAFLFLLHRSRKLDSRLLFVGTVAGIFAIVFVTFFGLEYGADVLRLFGRDPTLTGRTLIWKVLAQSILKRPLLGYGFYAFWQGIKGESANVIYLMHWSFGYAHNGIIEIFLQLGSVGVVIFFVTLFKAIKDALFCLRNDRLGTYDWYLGLLIITIFYNIDEATVVWPNDLLSILYIVTCCGLAVGVKRLQQKKLVVMYA